MDTNISEHTQMSPSIQTPVLMIIFNRPDKTRALVDALARVKPSRVFISADGPRAGMPGEKERCEETRKIAQSISWPCEIITNFSDTNRGCRIGVSSAISWFFSQVEEGIILEDDCVPEPSFFPFCADLLARYRDDGQIMHIGGTTFLDASETGDPNASYHFSNIAHIWGWATWRRAWSLYDIEMPLLDGIERTLVDGKAFSKKSYARFWSKLFAHVRDRNIDTWDSQWAYSILIRGGLSITPNLNLVENIGFDTDATHTKEKNKVAKTAQSIRMPLTHPRSLSADLLADENLMEKAYVRSPWKRLSGKIISLFS